MITLKRPLRPLLGMLAVAAGAAAVWCGVCLHETPPHLAIPLSAQPHEALFLHDPQVQVVLLKRRSQFDR